LNNSGDGEGSVLYAEVDRMNTIEITDESKFEDCSVDTNGVANGGAIYIHLKYGYFYTHGNTLFKNCFSKSTSDGKGEGFFSFSFFLSFFFILLLFFFLFSGGIYINIEDSSSSFDLSNTTYTDCSATHYGDNIFIYGYSLSKIINKQKFENVITSGDEKLFYEQWKENDSYLSLVDLISKSGAIYLNEEGSLDTTCGNIDNPCKYIFFFLFLIYLFIYLFIFFF
jgi:hypothetical protein